MNHIDFMRSADLATRDSIDLFGMAPVVTQCGFCDRVVPLQEAVVSTYHITETLKEVEHFCSKTCAVESWEAFHARD